MSKQSETKQQNKKKFEIQFFQFHENLTGSPRSVMGGGSRPLSPMLGAVAAAAAASVPGPAAVPSPLRGGRPLSPHATPAGTPVKPPAPPPTASTPIGRPQSPLASPPPLGGRTALPSLPMSPLATKSMAPLIRHHSEVFDTCRAVFLAIFFLLLHFSSGPEPCICGYFNILCNEKWFSLHFYSINLSGD